VYEFDLEENTFASRVGTLVDIIPEQESCQQCKGIVSLAYEASQNAPQVTV